jgi:hypothetical protein
VVVGQLLILPLNKGQGPTFRGPLTTIIGAYSRFSRRALAASRYAARAWARSWYLQQTLDAIHHPTATIGAFPLPGQTKFECRIVTAIHVYLQDLFSVVILYLDGAQI